MDFFGQFFFDFLGLDHVGGIFLGGEASHPVQLSFLAF